MEKSNQKQFSACIEHTEAMNFLPLWYFNSSNTIETIFNLGSWECSYLQNKLLNKTLSNGTKQKKSSIISSDFVEERKLFCEMTMTNDISAYCDNYVCVVYSFFVCIMSND